MSGKPTGKLKFSFFVSVFRHNCTQLPTRLSSEFRMATVQKKQNDMPIIFMLTFFYFRDTGVPLKQKNRGIKVHVLIKSFRLLILLIFSFLVHWHHGTIGMALLLWSVAIVTIDVMIHYNGPNSNMEHNGSDITIIQSIIAMDTMARTWRWH